MGLLKHSFWKILALLGLFACNDVGFDAESNSPADKKANTVAEEDGSSALGEENAEKGKLSPVPKKQDSSLENSGDAVGDKVDVGEKVVDEIDVDVNFLEEFSGAADLIFLVDTSASMAEEQTRLEENLNLFLQTFDQAYGDLDFQVIMIGKNFNFPSIKKSEFEIVEHELIGYDSLDYLMGFLKSPGLNQLQLRKGVRKEAIIISDTNAKTRSAEFLDYIKDNKEVGPVGINGMVGIPTSKQTDWCQIAGPGSAYIDLSKAKATSGYIDDVCSSNWGNLLEALAKKIVQKNTMIELALSSPVVSGGRIDVLINGEEVNSNLYRVNYANNTILLSGGASLSKGDNVSVKYESK